MPVAIAAIVYAIVLLAPPVLNDGDTWLHIAVGRWIIETRGVPWTDPFSLTLGGTPWTAHEWLSELAMAAAYRVAGLSGVLILTGAAAALAVGLLATHLRRWLDPFPAVMVMIFAIACTAPSLLARPHILALPALELWSAGLLLARSRAARPSYWLLPLMTLWANLHGSFPFGLALVVPFALEAAFADPPAWRRNARDWAGFLAASIAAAMITPYGWHTLMLPIRLLGMHQVGQIGEWRPVDFSSLQPLELALMALLYLCLTRGVRLPPVRLLVLLGLLHMALSHARHGMLLGFVAPLLLAEPLAPVVNGAEGTRGRAPAWRIVAAGLAAVLTVGRLAWPVVARDGTSTPVTALEHVPAALWDKPVFNDYSFGSVLIFDGIRPFVDSRAELYGDKFLVRYQALIRPDRAALEETLRQYGIAWTIMPPGAPVAEFLDTLPGWGRAYADGFAVVHVKREAGK
jgi:hypothetical protein